MYKAPDVTRDYKTNWGQEKIFSFHFKFSHHPESIKASLTESIWIVVSQKVLAFKKAFRFSHCMALKYGLHIYTRCTWTISNQAVIQAHSESVLNEILQFGWIIIAHLSLWEGTWYFSLSPEHWAGTEVIIWFYHWYLLPFACKGCRGNHVGDFRNEEKAARALLSGVWHKHVAQTTTSAFILK